MTAATVTLARRGLAICLVGATLGALGLVGWLFHVGIVTTFVAGRPAIVPNTALGLMMAGLAAASCRGRAYVRRPWSLFPFALSVGVFAIGATTIAEYAFDRNLGIDDLVFPAVGPDSSTIRSSPLSALLLTLFAGALLTPWHWTTRSGRPSEWLALIVASLAFVSLIGHLYGLATPAELRKAPVMGVALPSAIGFLLIAVGFLLRSPANGGVMRLVTSSRPSGILVRRLGLVALLAPPLVGLIAYRMLAGFVDVPLTLAVLAMVVIAVAMALILVTAGELDEVHNALEVSRARARAFFEESVDAFFVGNLAGVYIDVNAAGCKMLGRTREEIVGRNVRDLVAPEEAERLSEVKKRLLAGEMHTDEWHLKRSDGTYLPVEVTGKILADGRWQGIVRDISRRKAAEEAARRSEAHLQGIIAIAADAIVSIDRDQRIVMYNEGAKKIFGWSPDEVMGKPLDVLIPRRFVEAHRGHVRGFEREPIVARMMNGRPTIVGVRKNGEEFPAEAAISKLEIDGQTFFTTFLRDVTVPKRLQEELHHAMQRFRFLAEAGEILGSSLETDEIVRTVALLAVESVAECCIVELSDGNDFVIRTRASASPKSDKDAVHVDRFKRDPAWPSRWFGAQGHGPVLVPHVDEKWLRSQPADDATATLVREEGAASFMKVPVIAGDRVIGVMLLLAGKSRALYVPTDLRLAVDLARRAGLAAENGRLFRAARAATRARDEMLSIVAHDLRSPLAAAQLGASLLARQVHEDAPRKTAETIQRSMRRAARLVDDLLDAARIDAGRLELHPKEVTPEAIVHDAVESFSPLAASVAVRLEAEVSSGLQPVIADEDRIQQAFGNLLDNAIKFTPEGGVVRVVAKREGDLVRFAVIDSGPGIATEHLPLVFDRFWQGRDADRRGAGLGLAIAKGIVDAHGGQMGAESVPGKGSTFSFTLLTAPGDQNRPFGVAA